MQSRMLCIRGPTTRVQAPESRLDSQIILMHVLLAIVAVLTSSTDFTLSEAAGAWGFHGILVDLPHSGVRPGTGDGFRNRQRGTHHPHYKEIHNYMPAEAPSCGIFTHNLIKTTPVQGSRTVSSRMQTSDYIIQQTTSTI